MIEHLLIGAGAATVFFVVLRSTRSKDRSVPWWGWIFTILAIGYGVFVLEVIVGFLHEGAGRAALVMGVILGFVAVVWGVLLQRFVFSKGTAHVRGSGHE
jgi:hypothetical protein